MMEGTRVGPGDGSRDQGTVPQIVGREPQNRPSGSRIWKGERIES